MFLSLLLLNNSIAVIFIVPLCLCCQFSLSCFFSSWRFCRERERERDIQRENSLTSSYWTLLLLHNTTRLLEEEKQDLLCGRLNIFDNMKNPSPYIYVEEATINIIHIYCTRKPFIGSITHHERSSCPSVGWSVGWLICHNFLKGLEVTRPCFLLLLFNNKTIRRGIVSISS